MLLFTMKLFATGKNVRNSAVLIVATNSYKHHSCWLLLLTFNGANRAGAAEPY